jgi:hypothetical protein
MGTSAKVIGAFIPGKKTRTRAFAISLVVEKFRVWGGFVDGATALDMFGGLAPALSYCETEAFDWVG